MLESAERNFFASAMPSIAIDNECQRTVVIEEQKQALMRASFEIETFFILDAL